MPNGEQLQGGAESDADSAEWEYIDDSDEDDSEDDSGDDGALIPMEDDSVS